MLVRAQQRCDPIIGRERGHGSRQVLVARPVRRCFVGGGARQDLGRIARGLVRSRNNGRAARGGMAA
jgi:hypothetical protein